MRCAEFCGKDVAKVREARKVTQSLFGINLTTVRLWIKRHVNRVDRTFPLTGVAVVLRVKTRRHKVPSCFLFAEEPHGQEESSSKEGYEESRTKEEGDEEGSQEGPCKEGRQKSS